MKLPNGERAVVDVIKLTDYCLDPNHPRGKHKARVFRSACGLSINNAESLRQQLLEAAEHADAVLADSIGFGAPLRVRIYRTRSQRHDTRPLGYVL